MKRLCTDEECERPNYAYGLCKMHYRRALAGKYPMPHRPTRSERFWSRVDKTDTCWLWPVDNCRGYGQYGKPPVLAHRFAYEDAIGPIPPGMELDHLCRVTRCVNPLHLEPVTREENNRRGFSPSAVNIRKTHCPQGHPYTEANTYRPPSGGRMCRACLNARTRARRARQRQVAAVRDRESSPGTVAAHKAASGSS